MTLQTITPADLLVKPYDLIKRQTFVLASGSFAEGRFNTMVTGWGFLGSMWNKPCAIVPVRPTRYTFDFIDQAPDFTLCAFPEAYKEDVLYLGTHSGRDEDKLSRTRITPQASQVVSAPSFAEAELVIECKKIYWVDLDPSRFLDPAIKRNYLANDYHRMYYGEMLVVRAEPKFIGA
jgi:Conserved protein/domain typically associated with flavoprotein oxygenases, DIM6/NTAB family